MPIDITKIKEEDRADFLKRLDVYGLEESAGIQDEFVTPANTITSLNLSSNVASKFQPVVLRTKDFDELNKWIGVPDKVSKKIDRVFLDAKPLRFDTVPLRRGETELPMKDALVKIRRQDMTTENLTSIRAAAQGFLFGDSAKFKEFKPWIEKVFPVVDVHIWPFLNITVKSGSVLEIGPGAHVLFAYTLTIEEGGVVRSHGNLKVDVVNLRKEKPFKVMPINPAILNALREFKRIR